MGPIYTLLALPLSALTFPDNCFPTLCAAQMEFPYPYGYHRVHSQGHKFHMQPVREPKRLRKIYYNSVYPIAVTQWICNVLANRVILRPTVSWPVCPGVRPPSGPVTNFTFSLKCLDSCRFVILSPAGLKTIFYCPNSWDLPNLEGQFPVLMSPRNRVAQIYPGHWVPFPSPLTTRRAPMEVFCPTSTRMTNCDYLTFTLISWPEFMLTFE
jgi:hypothetical protein